MLIEIDSLDDPRVAPYRNLKDRDLAREGDRFLAEGELVTRRLLSSATHRAESLLLARRRVEAIRDVLPGDLPCYVAPDAVVNEILGFKFHSGVMSVGIRPPSPTIAQVVPAEGPCRLLVCPKVASTDNLGSLARIAAGFGCDALVLGEESCDPYYRQSIRVSMGAVFSLPIVRSGDVRSDLRQLRDTLRVRLWATVLDDDAAPLDALPVPPRVAVLMGNESAGLERDIVASCTDRVTIPMKLGVDSLNVAVSAGVFLYALTRRGSQQNAL
jgi:tRNA G18 (ribose-2'-O)-methylase SpoU